MKERKVLGILSIIFGGLGLLLSWIPIVNNFAFFLGIISLVLGIIALVINRKNKKLLSIIGTVLSVTTIIIVIATQGLYANSLDKATKSYNKEVKKIDSSSGTEEQSSSASSSSNAKKDFKVGETASISGVEYTVTKVSYSNGDGDMNVPDNSKQYVFVDVTIKNNSDKDYEYNPLDFQLSNNGNKTDNDYVDDDFVQNQFTSGTLSPNASYSGTWVGQSGSDGNLSFTYKDSLSNTSDFEFQLR